MGLEILIVTKKYDILITRTFQEIAEGLLFDFRKSHGKPEENRE